MAQKSRAKFEKRQKELARQDKQKLKRARKLESREPTGDEAATAADPDAPESETEGAPSPDEP